MPATLRSLLVFSALIAFCTRVTLGDELLQQLRDPMPATSAPVGEMDELASEGELLPDEIADPEIMLREDGEFAGRVRVIWPTGKIEPAAAELAFLQNGEIISSAQTDEKGHFQLTGLEPGNYVARATIEQGSKDFEIAVVNHVPEALPSQMFMDATLTPMPDAMGGEILADTCGGCGMCDDCLATEVPLEECGIVEPYEECMMGAPCASSCGSSCGFSGGGCCGGGGGGLGLLGLAGLAGLVGLDDDDPASPAGP